MTMALIERAAFAKSVGVHPSTVTRACKEELAPACIGNRIDMSHPLVRAYVEKRTGTPPYIDATTGLDVLFDQVSEWCVTKRVYDLDAIKGAFKIGSSRAQAMLDILKLFSTVPVPDVPTASVVPSYRAVPDPPIAGGNGAGAGASSSITGMLMPSGRDPVIKDFESITIPDEIQSVADLTLREIIAQYGTNTRFIEWLKAIQAIEAIEEKRLKNAQIVGKLVSRDLIADYVIEPIDATIRQMLTDCVKTIVSRLVAMHDAGEDTRALEELVADQMSSFFKPMKKKIIRGLDNA